MNSVLLVLSWLFLTLGTAFLLSGALGLLRFPDLFSRLHAATKADTVGLGFLAAGLACRADSVRSVLMLLTIWLLVMASGAVNCQLLARLGAQGLMEREFRSEADDGD